MGANHDAIEQSNAGRHHIATYRGQLRIAQRRRLRGIDKTPAVDRLAVAINRIGGSIRLTHLQLFTLQLPYLTDAIEARLLLQLQHTADKRLEFSGRRELAGRIATALVVNSALKHDARRVPLLVYPH